MKVFKRESKKGKRAIGNYIKLETLGNKVIIDVIDTQALRRDFLKDYRVNPPYNEEHLLEEYSNSSIERLIEDLKDKKIQYISDAQLGCRGPNEELVPIFGIIPLSNTPLIAIRSMNTILVPSHSDRSLKLRISRLRVFHFPLYQTTSELLTLLNGDSLVFREI